MMYDNGLASIFQCFSCRRFSQKGELCHKIMKNSAADLKSSSNNFVDEREKEISVENNGIRILSIILLGIQFAAMQMFISNEVGEMWVN